MKQILIQIHTEENGQAMIVAVILFLAGMLILLGGIATSVLAEIRIVNDLEESKQSLFTAEAAMEDAAYRLAVGMNYNTALEVLTIASTTATTTVADVVGGREISVKGDALDAIRNVKALLILGEVGIGFHYGAHIGEGGLVMTSNSIVNGNVFSNENVTGYSNSVINGDAAAVGTVSSPDPTVNGSTFEDEPEVALPPIDLDYWRNQANINNDSYVGNYSISSGSATFGPKKFEGNFTLDSNAEMTITGPIHITGNFAMNSNTHLYLDNSFGSKGTVIVVDGTIAFNSNALVHATAASPRGYILFVTPSTSSSAIELNSNTVLEAAIYATAGTVAVNSNGDVIAVTAYKLQLNSNAEINYDIGLANANFSSGPEGGFSLADWEEVE